MLTLSVLQYVTTNIATIFHKLQKSGKKMTKNGSRSFYSLNGIEPTPNREQRGLAHFTEVRRRKTVGQWHSFAKAHLMTSRQIHYYMPFSTRRVRMSFCAIQGAARMPLNVIPSAEVSFLIPVFAWGALWLFLSSFVSRLSSIKPIAPKNLQFLPHNF